MCVCAVYLYRYGSCVFSYIKPAANLRVRTYTRLSESFIYRVQIKRDRVAGTEISSYIPLCTNIILCRRDDDVIINTSRANRIRI